MTRPERFSVGEVRRFWERQADQLHEFRTAPTTGYYREDEQRIIRHTLPSPEGLRVLKLDLWNEVKNTDILSWLSGEGAITHAVDISYRLAHDARARFRGLNLIPRFSVANLYHLPFRSACFDYVYTMGSIEHAPEMRRCVAEVFRVLKPGGFAVVGVPNKHDPFLRPLAVHIMNLLGIYPYGMEQSLTRGQLSRLLQREGFEVIRDVGVLFMPGMLRMAELCLHGRFPGLAKGLGALHWPFRLAVRAFPGLSRHGYLIAWVVRKPPA